MVWVLAGCGCGWFYCGICEEKLKWLETWYSKKLWAGQRESERGKDARTKPWIPL